MRELHTIGSLASPLNRQRQRRASVTQLYRMGDTNPSFTPPSAAQLAANPPGEALANAAVALLAYFNSAGVPSEHSTAGGNVSAFQAQWNADPISQTNGSNSQLSVDDAYGPNTHDALAVIAGSAPAVNTGPAQTPTNPLVNPTPAPIVPGATTGGIPWAEILLIAAIGGGVWFLVFKKKRSKSVHHRAPTTAIEVRSNPRKRSRARRSSGAIV
jgi:hypothetical protein